MSSSSAPQIVIHVGEPKTGTTFLQQVMFGNREVLAEQGLTIPGPRAMFHWRAAQDLLEVVQISSDPVGPFRGSWDKLVKQALQAERVGVVSHELLASANFDQAARGVQSFTSEGADVHVVITVRDIGSLLPAEWQETVKHRNVRGWRDWLADVIDNESEADDRRRFWFWRVHDTLAILRNWGHLLPPQNVHVITMPPRGSSPDLLWERFAGVVGVDPASVDLGAVRANASLGLAEIELLRRVNAALPRELPDWFYMWHVKEALAHDVLSQRPKTGGRLEIPERRDEWARKHAEAVIAELRTSDYDIVGDLEELVPRPPDGPRAMPSDASFEDMVGAGVDAIVKLLQELAEAKNVGGPERQAAQHPAVMQVPAVAAAKRRFVAYAERHMWAHQVRRAYWRWANSRSARR